MKTCLFIFLMCIHFNIDAQGIEHYESDAPNHYYILIDTTVNHQYIIKPTISFFEYLLLTDKDDCSELLLRWGYNFKPENECYTYVKGSGLNKGDEVISKCPNGSVKIKWIDNESKTSIVTDLVNHLYRYYERYIPASETEVYKFENDDVKLMFYIKRKPGVESVIVEKSE